jgi:hypothetical protein
VRVVEQLAHLDPLPERSCPLIAASVSYGTLAEHGLYFLAFSSDCARHDVILSRMFGTAGDGLHDRSTSSHGRSAVLSASLPPLSLLVQLAKSDDGETDAASALVHDHGGWGSCSVPPAD